MPVGVVVGARRLPGLGSGLSAKKGLEKWPKSGRQTADGLVVGRTDSRSNNLWSGSVIGLGLVFWAAVGSSRGVENMGASEAVSDPSFNLDWVLRLGKKDYHVCRR